MRKPPVAVSAMGEQKEEVGANGSSKSRAMRILVIDDDDSILCIVRKMLDTMGYVVETCQSAADALRRLEQQLFHAILCDIWMPGMNGAEFYRLVKAEFPEYRSKIVFMTGDFSSQITWEFIDQRRLPYLLKPVSLHELQKRIEQITADWRSCVPPAEPPPGAVRRRHRRVALKARVRVRRKKLSGASPEIAVLANLSQGGMHFIANQEYESGAEVWLIFPYTGQPDPEQLATVVRSERRPDGKWGVSTQWVAAPNTSSQAARSTAVEFGSATGYPNDEMADLLAAYEHVGMQRDRLASRQAQISSELEELIAAKRSMSEVVDDLKLEIDRLQTRLSSAEAHCQEPRFDSATRVWNRGAIIDLLRQALEEASSRAGDVGVILVDLDHFKTVNDTHGREAGDHVLHEAARRISAAVEISGGAIGRYGGEEFLVVLPDSSRTQTAAAGERILLSMSDVAFEIAGTAVRLTASIGVTTAAGSLDAETIVRHADEALYRAKNHGRNRVEVAGRKIPAAHSA